MLTTHLGVVPRLMSSSIPLLSLYASMASAGTALSFLPLFSFIRISGNWNRKFWMLDHKLLMISERRFRFRHGS